MLPSSSSSPTSAEQIGDTVAAVLGDKAKSVKIALGEVTVTVAAADYLAAATLLLQFVRKYRADRNSRTRMFEPAASRGNVPVTTEG